MTKSQEPLVKKKLKAALDQHPDRIDHFTVATRGMGSSGVADRCGTVKLNARGVMGAPIGVAFRIECKGFDTTKKSEPTALQLKSLLANAKLGGFSALCRPIIQTVYFSDDTSADMQMRPDELVEYMLSGEWVR